ncbi:MAG: hypothetical protein EZS28_002020 [Streblomastix strix]|uniref:Uncharacterized protein n=1 Tax=Streblomastix strix TaxID=222440 RepID=A0A5J4X5G3_9EUKA|nr:MAG: hypothetical protein EZS28_002020 [Streblomastix strix]
MLDQRFVRYNSFSQFQLRFLSKVGFDILTSVCWSHDIRYNVALLLSVEELLWRSSSIQLRSQYKIHHQFSPIRGSTLSVYLELKHLSH